MTTGTLKDCKPGAYIMVDGEPCKVLNYAKSKPGKHGAAKVRIEVIGLFDEKKRQVMQPAAAQVDIPILDKKKAQVISVEGKIANLMDLEDYSTFDANIPAEFEGKLESGMEVEYWKFNQQVAIKLVRGLSGA